MIKSIERFAELYDILGIKYEIVNDILWRDYNRMVIPVGPAKLNYSINQSDANFLLSKFTKSLLVRCTDGFKNIPEGSGKDGWYSIICDKFNDLDSLPSKNRAEIRRGLNNCSVKKVDASFIASNGFNVYRSALNNYKGVGNPPMQKKFFEEKISKTKGFDDIIHYHGVFHKNKLIAYSENFVYDKIEVSYSTIKFDPNFLKLYPSYALIYEMNKFYLEENKIEYVNDGFRSILHQTNIQKYLIDKFNFKKAHTNLYISYRPYLTAFLSLSFPARKVIEKLSSKLKALYELEKIKINKYEK